MKLIAKENLFAGAILVRCSDRIHVRLAQRGDERLTLNDQEFAIGGAARNFLQGECLEWNVVEPTADILHSWNCPVGNAGTAFCIIDHATVGSNPFPCT